ncbi:MAG TPA: hypothetical protein VFY84_14145 [Jiangellales bacterium]|nr:hypothetical protein [Jiangellales bacterium]
MRLIPGEELHLPADAWRDWAGLPADQPLDATVARVHGDAGRTWDGHWWPAVHTDEYGLIYVSLRSES